jgi:hypothetical protein
MTVRTYGKCEGCGFWRDAESDVLAGTPKGAEPEALGECRRRVQTNDTGLKPRQPLIPAFFGCAEHLVLPLPDRLPQACSDCRFWRRRKEGNEGHCCAWAPRHLDKHPREAPEAARFTFPVTPPNFFCGDGVSINYVDPDEEQLAGAETVAVTGADPLDPNAAKDWDWPPDGDKG